MYKYLFIIVLIFISACINTHNSESISENVDSVQTNLKKQISEIDTFTNDFAKFLCGRETKLYKDFQNQDFYLKHISETDSAWKNLELKMLNKIKLWVSDNNTTNKADSVTLFYPFSGPDFLFADVFFPYCNDYIFFGLENPGSIPFLGELPDSTINAYLKNLRISLQYSNENGFFLTKQMKEVFKNVLLNGATQIILFYISKLGYDIVDFQPFYLDPFGNVINQEQIIQTEKNVQGIKISFKDSVNRKNLYYFQLDVSDLNLKEHLEFIHFLNTFENKITYMKSASYLLHRDEFSMIREITLKQSIKILQDDSGIPFKLIQNADYDIDIYGNYTKTVALFEERYQSDLRNAVIGKFKKSDLDFNLGYNIKFNETVLIFAKNKYFLEEDKSTVLADNVEDENVIYKVQIKIFWDKLSNPNEYFAGLPEVDYYFDGGYYKYTIGSENSESECDSLIKLANQMGFDDAFVAAFYKGQRITLDEAAKKSKKKEIKLF